MASSSPGDLNASAWNASLADDGDVSSGARAAFLLVFMLLTLAGDVFLLTAILAAPAPRRRLPQTALIANACALGLMDCVCNMGLVLASVAADDWRFGGAVCKANMFFMSVVGLQTPLLLLAFTCDQFLTLRFSHKYQAFLTPRRLAVVLVTVWLHSTALSVALLTDAVPSAFRPQLHVCTVTGNTPSAFVCFTLVVCFLLPVLAVVALHAGYARLACKLRYAQRAAGVGKTYTQMSREETTPMQVREGSRSNHLSPALFTLWLILHAPWMVSSYTRQYEHSQSLEDGSVLSYPWEVDAAFLWMRFLFSALFPGVAFLCRKDLWQSAKDYVLCRRNNAIVDMKSIGLAAAHSPVPRPAEKSQSMVDTEDPREPPPPRGKDPPRGGAAPPATSAFTVPVLFATSTGICIEDASRESVADESSDSRSSTGELAHLRGKTLDVRYPPECELAYELAAGETSDYDSFCELDVCSRSQPAVSIRTIAVQGSSSGSAPHRRRSLSDPDMTSVPGSRRPLGHGLAGSGGADSGLDLTGGTPHSSGGLTDSTRLGGKVGRTVRTALTATPSASSIEVTSDSEHVTLSLDVTPLCSLGEKGQLESGSLIKNQAIGTPLHTNRVPHHLEPLDKVDPNRPAGRSKTRRKHLNMDHMSELAPATSSSTDKADNLGITSRLDSTEVPINSRPNNKVDVPGVSAGGDNTDTSRTFSSSGKIDVPGLTSGEDTCTAQEQHSCQSVTQ